MTTTDTVTDERLRELVGKASEFRSTWPGGLYEALTELLSLRTASPQSGGVVVKPLHFTTSKVFGADKMRAVAPTGEEFAALICNGLDEALLFSELERDEPRHQSQLPPEANKFHVGNGDDGKHYWLTPWQDPVFVALKNEFGPFDFDPCPYPLPEGFDGLTCEWGQSNYVNPPFGSIMHQGKKSLANIFKQPLWKKLTADFLRSPGKGQWEIAV